MTRYIDADALISHLQDDIEMCDTESDLSYGCLLGLRAAICYAEALTSNEGAECPVCHGTGRIGTTDWLIRGMTEEQLAKEKADAIAEANREMRREVAREIFAEIEDIFEEDEFYNGLYYDGYEGAKMTLDHIYGKFAELKKKYTEGEQ